MWPALPEQLIAYQHALALARPTLWRPHPGTLALGACVVVFARGYSGPGAAGDRAWVAATVLRDRQALSESGIAAHAGGTYAPGLLALREGPCLEAAVRALDVRPDVLLVDGTGRDHPRRAGLAIHLGAVLDLPTIGVTHRPLLASGPWPEDRQGSTSPLRLDGELVGMWLRTRAGARPLAIHAAWRTDLDTAVQTILAATYGPLRQARTLARTARARHSEPDNSDDH